MTNKEKLHILIPAMMQCVKEKIEILPEKGPFQSHLVTTDYPGTKYKGFLRYEQDLTDETGVNRRLTTAMSSAGSDHAAFHYIFKGTKAECLAWLEDKNSEGLLIADYASLKERVDRGI